MGWPTRSPSPPGGLTCEPPSRRALPSLFVGVPRLDVRRLGHASRPQHVGEEPHRFQRRRRADLLLDAPAQPGRAAARPARGPAPAQAGARLGEPASAAAVLPLTLVRDAGDVWIVYAVAVLYGVSFVVLPAALNGLLKELVPDERAIEANSTLQTVRRGSGSSGRWRAPRSSPGWAAERWPSSTVRPSSSRPW